MTKWTPEPWDRCDFQPWLRTKDNLDRAFACTTALAGLNPEGVRELVEAAEAYFGSEPVTLRVFERRGEKVRAALAAVRLK